MKCEELTRHLETLLDLAQFKDYCPNGLQVEGRAEVVKLVAGVTACQALLDAAVERSADALLVHHGWFWRSEDGRVTGVRRTRLKTLLEHDINLLAFHLPLDAHPEFGNNAQLAKQLDWTPEGRFGAYDLGWFGRTRETLPLNEVARRVAEALERPPQVIGDPERPISRVAWCSGGAQDWFEAAVALGVDAFLSGEISEHNVHLARESGVAYIAAGHHATERGGVRALAAHIAERFGIDCEFIDVDNPV
ncbi:MAG: Nif3-like dinuclear metal center hexameric protein [Candidatus Accumulibacter sp.]|jgi:dinuclear metal center YbgI/SA1388 family protein|nr:Nif3-like dinuclear metal center hexameric protein [Accumulibacter sp.]